MVGLILLKHFELKFGKVLIAVVRMFVFRLSVVVWHFVSSPICCGKYFGNFTATFFCSKGFISFGDVIEAFITFESMLTEKLNSYVQISFHLFE